MDTYRLGSSTELTTDVESLQIVPGTARRDARCFVKCLIAWAGAVLIATNAAWCGAADEPKQPAGRLVVQPATTEAASDKQAEADPIVLPEGGVDELVKFINQWRTFRPKNQDEFKKYVEARTAVNKAADKILEMEKDQSSDAFKLAQRVSLGNKVATMFSQNADGQRAVYEEVKAFLMSHEPDESDASLAMQTAMSLGYRNQELAIEAATALAPRLAASSNEKLQKAAANMTGMVRRLKLKGNEMILSGKTMDGQSFELASLRGKVVLIDFWATWCGPCRAEAPNIKKNYEAYHDQGFDVVGVSLDEDRTALEKYLEEEKTPWTTLHQNDGSGWGHPAALYYGIQGIPTMILVGKDGKVLSIEARGEKLDKLLAEQFGAGTNTAAETGGASDTTTK